MKLFNDTNEIETKWLLQMNFERYVKGKTDYISSYIEPLVFRQFRDPCSSLDNQYQDSKVGVFDRKASCSVTRYVFCELNGPRAPWGRTDQPIRFFFL